MDYVPDFALLPVTTLLLLITAARVVLLSYFAFDPYHDEYVGHPRAVAALAEMFACL